MCAVDHVLPVLPGRCTDSRKIRAGGKQIDVPVQWEALCPLCGAQKLTLTVKGRLLDRHCQKCKAPQPELTAAMIKLFPQCFRLPRTAPERPPLIQSADVTAIALSGMQPISMKLALLELAGMATPEALDKLGVRRENRPRVIARRVIRTDANAQVVKRAS